MTTNAHGADDGFEYDPTQQVYRTDVGEDESLSIATVTLVSEAVDRDPLEIPPLERTIDTDALEELFRATRGGERSCVEFTYAGCEVRVHGNRRVVVDPL